MLCFIKISPLISGNSQICKVYSLTDNSRSEKLTEAISSVELKCRICIKNKKIAKLLYNDIVSFSIKVSFAKKGKNYAMRKILFPKYSIPNFSICRLFNMIS